MLGFLNPPPRAESRDTEGKPDAGDLKFIKGIPNIIINLHTIRTVKISNHMFFLALELKET